MREMAKSGQDILRRPARRAAIMLAAGGTLALLLFGCGGCQRAAAPNEPPAADGRATYTDSAAVPTNAAGIPEEETAVGTTAATGADISPDGGSPTDATPVIPLEPDVSETTDMPDAPSTTASSTEAATSSVPSPDTTATEPFPTLPPDGVTLPFVPA